jgi:NAD(P)-dependent dehydrogenase (short-subunit alcohol dehydrogenase family)
MKNHYVITGAGRGIGLELTKQALEAGHKVSALVRSPEKATGIADLSKKFSQTLHVFPVDVLSDTSVQTFVRDLAGEGVDVLINNAGKYLDGSSGFEDLDLQKVAETFATNSIGPMRMAQALLPNLKKSKTAKIANITSLMGSIGDNESGGSYAYRMSKTALNMFNKSFSIDFPEITSFVVHPGWVKTDMGGAGAPTQAQESAKGIHQIITRATKKDSGHFFDFEGESLPW